MNRLFHPYYFESVDSKDQADFAQFFLKSYSTKILMNILKLLEQYRNGVYVSPRVLQQCIIYVEYSVVPEFTWKFLKQHMLTILQEILYPLMCHTDEDDDLFENDPVEYIKTKYSEWEIELSLMEAARDLVERVANKRQQMLEQAMLFCMQVF